MPGKCFYCGKTVFFAEKTVCDSKEMHGPCALKYMKEKKERAKDGPVFRGIQSPSSGDSSPSEYSSPSPSPVPKTQEAQSSQTASSNQGGYDDMYAEARRANEGNSNSYMKSQIEIRKEEAARKKEEQRRKEESDYFEKMKKRA